MKALLNKIFNTMGFSNLEEFLNIIFDEDYVDDMLDDIGKALDEGMQHYEDLKKAVKEAKKAIEEANPGTGQVDRKKLGDAWDVLDQVDKDPFEDIDLDI